MFAMAAYMRPWRTPTVPRSCRTGTVGAVPRSWGLPSNCLARPLALIAPFLARYPLHQRSAPTRESEMDSLYDCTGSFGEVWRSAARP